MKVLDSTFLIDLIRGKKELITILNDNESLVTTQINMYEIITGFYLKGASEEKIQRALEMFENIKVLPLDDTASKRAAEISASLKKRGETIEDCDCLIAGIALSKGVTTIITRNTKDFRKIKGFKVETY